MWNVPVRYAHVGWSPGSLTTPLLFLSVQVTEMKRHTLGIHPPPPKMIFLLSRTGIWAFEKAFFESRSDLLRHSGSGSSSGYRSQSNL